MMFFFSFLNINHHVILASFLTFKIFFIFFYTFNNQHSFSLYILIEHFLLKLLLAGVFPLLYKRVCRHQNVNDFYVDFFWKENIRLNMKKNNNSFLRIPLEN